MEYNLPNISFVGGETKSLSFQINLEDCLVKDWIVCLSIAKQETATPIFRKNMEIDQDNKILTCTLESRDTIDLAGDFIYQITIKSLYTGEIGIPGQGKITIYPNIDKDLIYIDRNFNFEVKPNDLDK